MGTYQTSFARILSEDVNAFDLFDFEAPYGKQKRKRRRKARMKATRNIACAATAALCMLALSVVR